MLVARTWAVWRTGGRRRGWFHRTNHKTARLTLHHVPMPPAQCTVPANLALTLRIRSLPTCSLASPLPLQRSGRREELLTGPLLYGVVHMLLTVVFWTHSPAGVVAVAVLCFGDGAAELAGRRARAKLWHNSSKVRHGAVAPVWAGTADTHVYLFVTADRKGISARITRTTACPTRVLAKQVPVPPAPGHRAGRAASPAWWPPWRAPCRTRCSFGRRAAGRSLWVLGGWPRAVRCAARWGAWWSPCRWTGTTCGFRWRLRSQPCGSLDFRVRPCDGAKGAGLKSRRLWLRVGDTPCTRGVRRCRQGADTGWGTLRGCHVGRCAGPQAGIVIMELRTVYKAMGASHSFGRVWAAHCETQVLWARGAAWGGCFHPEIAPGV